MFEMESLPDNHEETLFKAEICLCNKDRFGLFFSDFVNFEPIRKIFTFKPKKIELLPLTQMF